MALSSQAIKNLKGGVSQQPDILRYPNQGKTQINGWSSETKGLQKRPPSVFIQRLAANGAFGVKPLIHLVNRDAFEQYYMVFANNTVRIFDLKGTEYPISGVSPYLGTANPREDLRLLTVADYTFVVNRQYVVSLGGELSHASYGNLNARALVACRGGQYGRTLKVSVNGTVLAIYQLPDGLNQDAAELTKEVEAMDAQKIVGVLVDYINNGYVPPGKPATDPKEGGTTVHGVTAVAGPSHIVLTATVPINTVQTEDGYADQLLSSLIYQVATTTKLPNSAPDGYLVEITGEATRAGDNYWVRYSTSSKSWRETVKPGIITGLDPASMPHAIVRQADSTFKWQSLDWAKRTCGDDETNPMPSLLDDKINDIFFFRNRLGFLCGENVVMSRTARYFQFFPSSVAASSDDDPIDVAISHNRVSILKYAVPFSEQLLLWSDQAQFVLTSNGIMTAKSAILDLTTEFDVMDTARPFGLGRAVYFSAPRAAYSSVKRYYAVADVSNVKNAEDISGHVPSYIPNKVHTIHGSGTENFITSLTDGDTGKLFVYKFLYQDEQLAQQSWSHWEFGASRILAAASIGSYTYLIQDRAEGITLERMEFTQDTLDFPNEPFRTYIDGKRVLTLTDYDIDRNETRINVHGIYNGTPDPSVDFWVVDAQGWADRFTHADWSGGYLRMTGDRRGQLVTVGRAFKFTYAFSKFLIKQQGADGTMTTEDSGRLQLRKVWVNYEASGSFNIDVWNGRNKFQYVMGGPRLGGGVYLGKLNLGTGQYRFSVTGNAWDQDVTASSDNPQPLNIIGCGFEGNYVRKSNGI